ncbi:MAG: hypothetical protein IID12_07645 [Candidatus Marinimicrobia bacterium]|nr:hypothetical protein [Candidatus Neomarinimicrobiota bacterium]
MPGKNTVWQKKERRFIRSSLRRKIKSRSKKIYFKSKGAGLIVRFAVISLFSQSLYAQTQSPGGFALSIPDSNSISYSLRNNTSVWKLGVSRKGRFGSGIYKFTEYIETTRLEFSRGEPRWKDDQKIKIEFELPVSRSLMMSANAYSSVFKDRHTGLFNDSQTNYFQLGVKNKPLKLTTMQFMGGPIWDSRREQSDTGYRFASTLRSRRLNSKSWNGEVNAAIYGERLQARENEMRRVNLKYSRKFYEATTDSFFANLRDKRQDYYISESGDIETRTESSNRFGNYLRYRLSDDIKMRWSIRVNFRETTIQSPRKEVGDVKRRRRDESTENLVTLSLNKTNYDVRLNAGFRSSLQKYTITTADPGTNVPLLSPDNEADLLTLSSLLNIYPSDRDSLGFRISSSRMRYDTPDTNNFDDRDELRVLIESGYSHEFTNDFRFSIKSSVNIDHIVYLFGERSADNHWNRVFLISSDVTAKLSPRLQTKQSFGVLANYYDYDYDDRIFPVRSLVLRNFIYTQSTNIKLRRRLNFQLSSRFELEEDGKLNWGKFLEQRVAERRITSIDAKIVYRHSKKSLLSIGLSRSTRSESRFTSIEDKGIRSEELVGFGPVFRILYTPRINRTFTVTGKIQRVENLAGAVYYTKFVKLVGSLLL